MCIRDRYDPIDQGSEVNCVCSLSAEKLGHSDYHEEIVREFHLAFLHENALNPMIFPCLRSASITRSSTIHDLDRH